MASRLLCILCLIELNGDRTSRCYRKQNGIPEYPAREITDAFSEVREERHNRNFIGKEQYVSLCW